MSSLGGHICSVFCLQECSDSQLESVFLSWHIRQCHQQWARKLAEIEVMLPASAINVFSLLSSKRQVHLKFANQREWKTLHTTLPIVLWPLSWRKKIVNLQGKEVSQWIHFAHLGNVQVESISRPAEAVGCASVTLLAYTDCTVFQLAPAQSAQAEPRKREREKYWAEQGLRGRQQYETWWKSYFNSFLAILTQVTCCSLTLQHASSHRSSEQRGHTFKQFCDQF